MNHHITLRHNARQISLAMILLTGALSAHSGPVAPISLASVSPTSPAGGSSDSLAPIMTPDGRYVLFASLADNLVTSNMVASILPPIQNVYLRDRLNQTTTLVSISANGTSGGNSDSQPAGISTNGQYVLFESTATNLVSGLTGSINNVFVRDMIGSQTLLVSVSTNGGSANGPSRSSCLTPDGSQVAFVSAASNLTYGITNGLANIFVRDLRGGSTTFASPGAIFSANGSSELPLLTPDGRYVAYYSTATNLVAGVTNSGEIYIRDLVQGKTTWASTDAPAIMNLLQNNSNVICCNHAISDNGQFIAFEACNPATTSTNPGVVLLYDLANSLTTIVNTNAARIISGSELNERNLSLTPDGQNIAFIGYAPGTVSTYAGTCVEVWNAQSNTTTVASQDLNQSIMSDSISDWPAISPDGQFVAFLSNATNLTSARIASGFHLYVRNLWAGITQLIDADTNGSGSVSNLLTFPRLSDDGGTVAFDSLDGALVPNDNNHSYDVFVRKVTNSSTELISAHAPSLPSLTPNGSCVLGGSCTSTNGRYLAFSSDADNLAPGDMNGQRDVFVYNLVGGTNSMVSADMNGISGDGFSSEPAISGTGRYVAFSSSANNLAANDNNNASDVFLRDLQAGTTILLSANSSGTGSGNGSSFTPSISMDGRYVLFYSAASDLVSPANSVSSTNIYWRDIPAGVTHLLSDPTHSTTYPIAAALTPSGQYVAFSQVLSGHTSSTLYLWSAAKPGNVYTNSATPVISQLGVSPDGNRIVYFGSTQVGAIDIAAKMQWVLGNTASGSNACQFTANSQYAIYGAADAQKTNQIYLFNFLTGISNLVSQSYLGAVGGNGNSDSPTMTPDGQFVAYRSLASNLVSGDSNGVPDIFLYDRLHGTNTLLSVSQYGNQSANNRSLNPVFSGDGQTLFWQSWAGDLTGSDFNQWCNLFALQPFATNSIIPGQLLGFSSIGLSPLPATNSLPTVPILTWPATPGVSYYVQFKSNLNDPAWQNLTNIPSIVGRQGSLMDFAPNSGQRFYRLMAF